MNATCSELARDEEMAGTAPAATAWLILEQPGPWGPDALNESGLEPELGAFLATLTPEYGIRVALARHVDRPEREDDGRRNVWLARVTSSDMQLRHTVMTDTTELLELDYAAMAIGYLPEIGEIESHPLLLVCTHGRRDACCAVHGRSLLTALLEGADDVQRNHIWECSHIGGHRFAPSTLTLPSGAVHGRVGPDEARDFLQRTMVDEVLPSRFRGRTCYPAPFQVAGAYVRRVMDVDAATELDVQRVVAGKAVPAHPTAAIFETVARAEVKAQDGRVWRLLVEQHEVDRIESCGAEPTVGTTWQVVDCEQLRG